MKEAHAHDIPISGPILQAKAQELAVKLGHPEFQCSNWWLSRFKTRKGIGFRTIKGAAKAIKPKAMDAWRNTILPKLLKDYSPDTPTTHSQNPTCAKYVSRFILKNRSVLQISKKHRQSGGMFPIPYHTIGGF